MTVPKSETLRAYLSATSVQEWLESELRASLADDLEPEAAAALVASVRAEAQDAADTFLESAVEPHEVVATVVVFARPGEDESGACGGIFTGTCSPMALLELAANECEPMDEVVISHRFASGEEVTLNHTWPFGLSEAVDLLTPGGASTPEDVDVPVTH